MRTAPPRASAAVTRALYGTAPPVLRATGTPDDIRAADGAHAKDPSTMAQQALSVLPAPHARAPHGGTAPAPTASRSVSVEGIGDVVDAGRRSGYAHLAASRLPTIGRSVAAARTAAAALAARPALRPALRGLWQPVPRAARRRTDRRLRVSAVALEPDGFASGPVPPHAVGMEVLFPVLGRAHLIASGPDGRMRSAAGLSSGRARVVGGASDGQWHLVNTGEDIAVVVRVTV